MHPEADAFLDAIFDNPDDDTPRLVYADWLQEHGQEDYARFLRLSVVSEGGSVPAEARRMQSERKGLWKRIRAVRSDAIVGMQLQDYKRGILGGLTTYGDKLVRTIASWWPAMTPPSLTVYGVRGFPPRSIEVDVATAIGEHLPWLRELNLLSYPVEHYYLPSPPLDGAVLAVLSRPGILSQLRALRIATTRADISTLRAFAESELIARLMLLRLDVRTGASADSQRNLIHEGSEPGAVRVALESFLAQHG